MGVRLIRIQRDSVCPMSELTPTRDVLRGNGVVVASEGREKSQAHAGPKKSRVPGVQARIDPGHELRGGESFCEAKESVYPRRELT